MPPPSYLNQLYRVGSFRWEGGIPWFLDRGVVVGPPRLTFVFGEQSTCGLFFWPIWMLKFMFFRSMSRLEISTYFYHGPEVHKVSTFDQFCEFRGNLPNGLMIPNSGAQRPLATQPNVLLVWVDQLWTQEVVYWHSRPLLHHFWTRIRDQNGHPEYPKFSKF